MNLLRTVCLAALAVASGAGAQRDVVLPVVREMVMAPGQRLDLDTGVVLRVPKEPPYVADLLLDRDGAGFYLEGAAGAQRGSPDDERPGEAWSNERLRLPDGRRREPPVVWFVRTDCASVARVEVMIGSTYTMGGAIVRWAVAPAKAPVFRAGPTELRPRHVANGVELSWSGAAAEYRVVVEGKGPPRTLVAKAPRILLEGLAAGEVHRARVHAVTADGVASLASEVAFTGARRKAKVGVLEYPDRWYDAADGGGVSLLQGVADAAQCEVVLYLYGVYVRGGGVQKLGKGEAVYLAAAELPESGYRPIYDRLDEGDVHAVRLPDGRHAKLWLEAGKNNDLRSGMRVHYAFLEGGGRTFVARPGEVTFALKPDGLELAWQPVQGAVRYRVVREGEEGAGSLVEASRFLAKGLEPNRFVRFVVMTVDGSGDESLPMRVAAHTYGEGYRVGTCALEWGEDGIELRTGTKVPRAAAAAVRLDLAVASPVGGGLRVSTPHGGTSTGGVPFGQFPKDLPDADLRREVTTDARVPESQVIWLKTGDGSLASVRVLASGSSGATFEYVLRLTK